MRTNIILAIILTSFSIGSCTSSKYLPIYKEIGVNAYGSKITVIMFEDEDITGELIAVDSSSLFVLRDSIYINWITNNIVIIPKDKIKTYRLKFAKSRDYLWSIPVFAATTASHGLYFILSLPVNLIVTTAIAAGTAGSFEYNDKEISYEELKMFARFPQGIPSGIDPSSIR